MRPDINDVRELLAEYQIEDDPIVQCVKCGEYYRDSELSPDGLCEACGTNQAHENDRDSFENLAIEGRC